jgi:uncharacterized protein (DUF849 family)
VHLHVKDADGVDTLAAAELTRVLVAVRRAAAMPVGVTTGAWTMPDPGERVAAIESWTALPDFASLNWHEDGADEVAAALVDRGVAIEAGLWNAQGVDAWLSSPYRDCCLRVLLELPDGLDDAAVQTEADLLLTQVREGSRGRPAAGLSVLLHGEGSSCWPALRQAARLGLDLRIGLEDTLEMPDGSVAPDNAALVGAARDLISTTKAL